MHKSPRHSSEVSFIKLEVKVFIIKFDPQGSRLCNMWSRVCGRARVGSGGVLGQSRTFVFLQILGIAAPQMSVKQRSRDLLEGS